MRILLTGSTGLLGSELARVLEAEGHTVVPFAHRLEKKGIEKKYRGKYDWVIHTAALTTVDRCEKDRELCWNINALGTKTMRDIAKASGARFLYISTASVFSGDVGNYKETDCPYPQNFYNLSKFGGEIFAEEYDKSMIVRLVILGVHSNGSRGMNFAEWLVDSYSQNKHVRLFNDVTINPLSTITASEQIVKLVSSKKYAPVVHLASKDRLTKAQIGKLILTRFPQYKGKVEEVSSAVRSATLHPKEIWLNANASAKKFGFKQPRIEHELKRILDRYFKIQS